MAKSEPRILEVNINVSGGGKMAVAEYGAEVYNWSSSFSERWSVPEDWDANQIDAFEMSIAAKLQNLVDEKNQSEFDSVAAESRRR